MLLYRTGLDWSAWETTVTRHLARAMGAKWAQAAALCLAALAAAAALDCFPCDVPDGCATPPHPPSPLPYQLDTSRPSFRTKWTRLDSICPCCSPHCSLIPT